MSANSRREFLGATLPGTLALGASVATMRPSTAFGREPQAAVRNNIGQGLGAKFALELDGVHAGWLDAVEGGDAVGNVVSVVAGPGNIQSKHLQGLKYEDIVLTCGTGMSKGFYDWIKAAFDKNRALKNGAIVTLDNTGKAVSRLEWMRGFVSEVGFPACDAGSKDPATLTVKITPEFTRTTMPSGSMASAVVAERWLASNFRLHIAGCPTACAHVSGIDAIVLKSGSAANSLGAARTFQVVPGQWEIPNLAVTAAEFEAAEFFNWHEDFVVQGHNTKDKEKTGTLEYLTPDLKALFTLSFTGLGIFKFASERVEAGASAIRRAKAEMYCDAISFAYSALA